MVSSTIRIGEFEITPHSPDSEHCEIYIVDHDGAIEEGGTFSLEEFRLMVAQYYHERF